MVSKVGRTSDRLVRLRLKTPLNKPQHPTSQVVHPPSYTARVQKSSTATVPRIECFSALNWSGATCHKDERKVAMLCPNAWFKYQVTDHITAMNFHLSILPNLIAR
jgi:hypothetical protein